MHRHPLFRATIAGLLALPAFAGHAATRLDLSIGANYSSGDYNDVTSTDVFSVPLTAKVRTGAWTFRLTVPYVHVDGPAGAAVALDDTGTGRGGSGNSGSGGSGRDHPEDDGGGDDDGTGGTGTTPTTAPRRASGLGDTTLSATYAFDHIGGSAAYVDIGGRVRLPTGNEDRGLGVGATDYGLNTEVGIDRGHGGAYVSAGRRFLGQVTGLDRRDGWQAGVGGWIDVGSRTTLGLGYDWRESSLAGGTAPREVYASVGVRMTDAWRLNVSANAGLSDASADYGAGVTLVWRAIDR